MWSVIKVGNTIGTEGSEGGKIIFDDEHSLGARVTLEKDGDIAPFSITVGVYGSFFHTVYMSSLDESESMLQSMKSDIDDYFKDPLKTETNWVESFVNRY